ncbi:MAG: exo-alpha-sialidase [Chloroflexi bacterium]|nr:MAG: exo-alpha-sialidase [Chloroflexota bacterium]
MSILPRDRSRVRRAVLVLGMGVAVIAGAVPVLAQSSDVLVSNGSPAAPFPQNKQNEPAIAVDANHPTVLAAGSNDEIDVAPCNGSRCPFTAGVGTSGIYFSFDSGATWTQPTYTGWSARTGTAAVGPIGTLPKYLENGLVSDGDPALAFGPQPDASGRFSWANGSRLYYANLTSNFPGAADETFPGFEALAVSRTDDVAGAAAGNAGAWMAPVIASRQSSTTFSDKEQIWADNAAASPFFGHVYVCNAAFRSQEKGHAVPAPLMVATSTDGGNTWNQQQVTAAVNNGQHPGQSGCTIRTDSHGVVDVFAQLFGPGTPGTGSHILIQSFDGGRTFTTPRAIFSVVDTCVFFDAVLGRCVMDGVAGARDDLSASPSVDIANGAPSGVGATDEIVDAWASAVDGINHEHVFVSVSTNGGTSWSSPRSVETAGDRGYYAAAAISPNGSDVYVVYNAFTTPFRDNTTDTRNLVGVLLHATVGSHGVPGSFSQVHRGADGDPRGSSQNNQVGEFLGDYVYAAATRTFGTAVWNDVRNAADCPAVDAWRTSIRTGGTLAKPAPGTACPATFGNSDIFGASTA